MGKLVTLKFRFEGKDLEDFKTSNDIEDLSEWVFGEMCQNLDFGFLVSCDVETEQPSMQ